jgi:MYXO-CTERM domain-containing protein
MARSLLWSGGPHVVAHASRRIFRDEEATMIAFRTRARALSKFAGGATLAVALGTTGRASACGGFWCSVANPVEQTSEQIIFVQNADSTTTCVVDIAYQGPSEHFAWVVPVEGVPQIDVSSGMAFDRLAGQTAPQYVMNRHVEGQCDQPMYYPTYSAGAGGFAGSAPQGAAAPAIDVLAQGSVGPYDYAVIKPNPALASPAQVALDWLKNEGYDVTGVSDAVLGPYLADGLNLIAFRLTKGTMVGSIRPVVLTYNGDKPSIPIRPTAVAAQDDMGVLVYVISKAQAVPQNYRSLLINEAAINWFNPTGSYPQVVSLAADQAGGQGFVTEMAGPSTALSNTVYTATDAATWSNLNTQTFADPLDLIWAANNSYRGWDGWKDAIAAAVTLPQGASLDDFGRNPNAYRGMPGFSVNAAVFLDQLDKNVVGPVRATQKLIGSRPYVTRLYTTMSPAEMTLDPVFTFNPDLAPVSNVHTAELYLECHSGIQEYQAPWRLELPQGGTISGQTQSGTWPMNGLPANRKIVQLSETGSGQVLQDNTQMILSTLVDKGGDVMPPSSNVMPSSSARTAPTASSPPPSTSPTSSAPPASTAPPSAGVPIGGYDAPPTGSPRGSTAQDSGCSVAQPARSSSQSTMTLVGALATLAAIVRRRRRRVHAAP